MLYTLYFSKLIFKFVFFFSFLIYRLWLSWCGRCRQRSQTSSLVYCGEDEVSTVRFTVCDSWTLGQWGLLIHELKQNEHAFFCIFYAWIFAWKFIEHSAITWFPVIHGMCLCSQAIATEGKYWKRRIEIVIREYHKWRTYFKKRVCQFTQWKSLTWTWSVCCCFLSCAVTFASLQVHLKQIVQAYSSV